MRSWGQDSSVSPRRGAKTIRSRFGVCGVGPPPAPFMGPRSWVPSRASLRSRDLSFKNFRLPEPKNIVGATFSRPGRQNHRRGYLFCVRRLGLAVWRLRAPKRCRGCPFFTSASGAPKRCRAYVFGGPGPENVVGGIFFRVGVQDPKCCRGCIFLVSLGVKRLLSDVSGA